MRKVLVIDDDNLVRSMIVTALGRARYAVAEAEDGMQAIRLLEDIRPEVIVTDIFMPHQDGIGVLQHVKAGPGPRPKIIAISGGSPRVRGDYLEAAKILGADAILQKPFSPDSLIDAIERVSNASTRT
jgi:two-component system, OmpR family, response regulator CpxR